MENSFSSHDYGCSTSQGIPTLLENLKGQYITHKIVNTIFTKSIYQQSCVCNVLYINTLPSGHAEMRDCSPMRFWRVTRFYVSLYDVLHICLSVGLAHLLLQGYCQLDAGCLGVKLQTDRSWPPIFRTIRLQPRDHSFRYTLSFPSVAIMTLHGNVLQQDDILCEFYVDTRSDVSD